MFPDGYRERGPGPLANVLCVDHDVDPDVVGMIASFAAVWISSLPFEAPMGAIRVGYVDDQGHDPAVDPGRQRPAVAS